MLKDIFNSKRPEDVFTPRSASVNKSMYVDRPEYERELNRALRSGYHIIIFGDSGCGKSWLYKKVFDEERVKYITIDLANAQNSDEIDLIFLDVVTQNLDWLINAKSKDSVVSAMPQDIGTQQNLRKKKKPHLFNCVGTYVRSPKGMTNVF